MNDMSDELVCQIALASVLGVGPRTYDRLIERCGSASAVFSAPFAHLSEIPRFSRNLFKEIQAIDRDSLMAQIRAWQRSGIVITCKGSPYYPEMICELPDPPPVLFSNVALNLPDNPRIAIVGSHQASKSACFFTEHLAQKLSQEGVIIVSGMAAGIDRAAHAGTLLAGGLTIAVLGNGILIPFPPANEDIYDMIKARGILVSELHPGISPSAGTLIARNRIIAALATMTLVVDAHRQGGTIETAMKTLKLGKKLMVLDSRSSGNRFLLRQGGIPFRDVQDVWTQILMECS